MCYNESSKQSNTKTNLTKTDINDFPKLWQRISKINKKLTNYYPCQGGDRSIQFSTLSNGDKLMYLNYDEQYFNFFVNQLFKNDDGYILKVFERKTQLKKTFKIKVYNKKDSLYYWTWYENEKEYKFLFTPFKNRFPIIYQPCKECKDIPCEDFETFEGKYKASLPYKLSLDGNDFRELNFTIDKDSISKLEIYYYPEDENEKGKKISFTGKTEIDNLFFVIKFKNFNAELLDYFNPKNEPKLEYLNDSTFRFKKDVKGLIIDDSFCENWEMKKYKD